MIEPRAEQLNAIGTAVPCQNAEAIKSQGNVAVNIATASPAPSVVVVDASKAAWIGIELNDRKKRPVAGALWELLLPNGKTVTGALDRNGKTRIEGIDPGQCTVKFPKLDRREFL